MTSSVLSLEGVAGVEAEAELLAAMVMFFQSVGLTAADVAIKVSSRQLLQAVLEQHKAPVESSRVFVTVDKMDKLPKETVSHFSHLAYESPYTLVSHSVSKVECCAYCTGFHCCV